MSIEPAPSAPSGGRRPRAGSRRPRLDLGSIVDTGLHLVRTEGLAAVSMRRIAEELGAAAMSLYRHVDDRQGLLVALLDRVARDLEAPPPQATPRAELREVLTAIHDGLARDPWVVDLLVTDGLTGPSIVPMVERAFAALHAAGLDRPAAARAYAALINYTYGEVLATRFDRPDSFGRVTMRAADPARHPHLAAIVAARPPDDPHAYYAETLERLLDALLLPGPGRCDEVG